MKYSSYFAHAEMAAQLLEYLAAAEVEHDLAHTEFGSEFAILMIPFMYLEA